MTAVLHGLRVRWFLKAVLGLTKGAGNHQGNQADVPGLQLAELQAALHVQPAHLHTIGQTFSERMSRVVYGQKILKKQKRKLGKRRLAESIPQKQKRN
ncbi:MAG: hypothetical protein EBY22_11080 [Gammaproteobacteria bacterium]|nr:hypothetical protein [Gammaproteobacteria bacterium]